MTAGNIGSPSQDRAWVGWKALYGVDMFPLPDLLAGLTVAMVAVPQGMGYAAIVGVNPLYGLYTAIVPAIIGSLFGSSDHLITGPTNATALATASVLLTFAARPNYVEYVFAFALITGLVRLILGLLRLGNIIRYVSQSVLTGFLAGAGILIIINQLHNVLGLARPAGANSVTLLWDLVHNLSGANTYALATALFTIGLLLIGRRLSSKVPVALLVIVLAGGLVQAAGWSAQGLTLIRDMGFSEGSGLILHLPDLPIGEYPALLGGAIAVALLSLVEAMSIAYTIMLSTKQYIDPSREFVGQGLASLVGGFFKCIPASGSLARSAVAYSSGGKTRLTGVFSGLTVLLMLLAFAKWIGYVPLCALAAVVTVSALNLVDPGRLKLTWQSPASNQMVLAVTFLATLLLPLHLAILLGTALSVATYLHKSSSIRLSYLCVDGSGAVLEYGLQRCIEDRPEIALINLEGTLYFAAIDDLEGKLEAVFQAGIKVLILRVRSLHLLAGAGVAALNRILERANEVGVTVLVCGVTDEIRLLLESPGLAPMLDSNQMFLAGDVLFESTVQAYQRARETLNSSTSDGASH